MPRKKKGSGFSNSRRKRCSERDRLRYKYNSQRRRDRKKYESRIAAMQNPTPLPTASTPSMSSTPRLDPRTIQFDDEQYASDDIIEYQLPSFTDIKKFNASIFISIIIYT